MKAFVADKIRRLEAAVMAVEGDEVLMQRAAAALARSPPACWPRSAGRSTGRGC